MQTLKEELRTFIEDSLPSCPPVFLDYMPEGQERAVQIIEYGAVPPSLPFDYGIWARRVQIVCKDTGARAAEDMAYALYEFLNSGLTEEERLIELSDGRKIIARPRELPFFMSREGHSSLYGFNLVVHTNRR
ncbi:MAG: minor capsid protein [Defluviitaleaceae bacterium]|nr:minor capsid protein [Defluviitaleaceae bacterium]